MEVNDEKLIDLAMYNAYYVLTGKKQEKDLINKDQGSFLYNPMNFTSLNVFFAQPCFLLFNNYPSYYPPFV